MTKNETADVPVLTTKPKRPSYYKSRRKSFFHDKKHDLYYFTVASDVDNGKFCFVSPKMIDMDGVPVIIGIETYKLQKPGSVVLTLEFVVELQRYFAEMPPTDIEIGRKIVAFRAHVEELQQAFIVHMQQQLGDEAKKINEDVLNIIRENVVTRVG